MGSFFSQGFSFDRTSLPSPFDTPRELIEGSQQLAEGGTVVAGFDLQRLDPNEIFRDPRAMNRLFEDDSTLFQQYEDQGFVTIQQLDDSNTRAKEGGIAGSPTRFDAFPRGGVRIEGGLGHEGPAGVVGSDLSPDFLTAMESAGIFSSGGSQFGFKGSFSTQNIEQVQEGFFPVVGEVVDTIAQRSLGSLGLLSEQEQQQLADAQPTAISQQELGFLRDQALRDLSFDPFAGDELDPVAAAELENIQQELRSPFASRGLSRSGAAASLEGSGVVSFLDQLRNERQARGFSTLAQLDGRFNQGIGGLGQAIGLTIDPLGVGLQMGHQQNQQDLFSGLLGLQTGQQAVASDLLRRHAKRAVGTSQVFKTNLAASGASSLGSLLGGGLLSGGGGGDSGGSGLGVIGSLLGVGGTPG